MQAKIQELLDKKPKHAVRIIQLNPELWLWVESNCDPACVSSSTKIYTALTQEPIVCPCGSGKLRKLISMKAGLSFCGRAGVCSAAKQTVSQSCVEAAKHWDKDAAKQKRAETNKKKYGVENIGQIAKAKQQHSEFYQDEIRVSSALSKMQATCLSKYGVSNPTKSSQILEKIRSTNLIKYGSLSPAQNSEIQNKIATTNIERYGTSSPFGSELVQSKIKKTNLERYGSEWPLGSKTVQEKCKQKIFEKYGRFHRKQVHISDSAYEILLDKNKFAEMLRQHGRVETSELLGVHDSTISLYHKKYDLDIIHPMSSSYEFEFKTWLESLGISFIQNDRTICNPFELDFYIPDYNLAIEFNGLYWHSEACNKLKNYHYDKTKTCKSKGIRLIHIFEDEWLHQKDICKSVISGALNQAVFRVPARKCNVRVVSNYELRKFLDTNHLQGYSTASYNIVLEFNGEIVAAMTFGHPRYNKKVEWELVRLDSRLNTQIIGGAQKMWKYFLKTKNPNSVVTYCDRRWFDGEIYSKLGFTKTTSAVPAYWYTDYEFRYHRSKYTKKRCVAAALLSGEFTEKQLLPMTEKYIAKEILGLDRVWDCGQDTWIWTK